MTWFWDACRIALWDICCTLTTTWREHLKIQPRDRIFLEICDARWCWKLRSKFAKGWWLVVVVFEMWFRWSLLRTKCNASQKPYLVELWFTCWDTVLRCIVPWVQRKKCKKPKKVCLWDIFCMLWMERISKTSMWRIFYLEICDARWWVKSKSMIDVRKIWDVSHPCFVFICRVTPPQQLDGFWFLRYVYSLDEVCCRRNATYLKIRTSHRWHGRTWFWDALPLEYNAKTMAKWVFENVARWLYVKGTTQNPGYVHVYWMPAWGCMSRGCLLTLNE